MTSLPSNPVLPIHHLAACFNSTVTTYKFYWFLSLVEEVEKGNYIIKKQDLFAGMIANAWYTVNYFNVRFGTQDRLERSIQRLIIVENLNVDTKKQIIIDTFKNSSNPETHKLLRYFDGEVPHRFLSPWFAAAKGDRQTIYTFSKDFLADFPYGISEHEITINPKWISYFSENSGILKSYCYWHLSLYLQKHNPNVPDIPNKLIKPARRNSLSRHRKDFRDIVIEHNGTVNCIYTQKPPHIGKYAVELLYPYAFVSHDMIWNLIPADPGFNSTKCDKLPPIDRYFDACFDSQMLGLKTVLGNALNKNTEKLLQDYLTFIPDLEDFGSLDVSVLKGRFKDNIQPLVTIASNNGFEFL